MKIASTIKQIAFVGDHLPRQCGIATYTSDICEAIATKFPACQCMVGAVNDRPEGYDYPPRIRFEIDEKELDSYRRAADFLNINNVEVVSVQHEFGIYGGPAGSHLLALLRDVRMPVVTTLHTLLREPNPDQRAVMKQLDEFSNRFIVMADRGKRYLEQIYGVAPEKIDVIPHGIPDIPFIDPSFNKDQFGVEGKTVLLTFGLLSSNKGIEHVIEALPTILSQHPNVVYIILGATHPNVIAHEGESYRLKLERLAEDRSVARHVIFYNRFVTLEELKEFIGAADIYITPYLNESQITSGTLAYTFGAGKAVISTPYWHAKELLAKERGILVPFADPSAIAEGVNRFLCNPVLMTATRKRAWKLGRGMIWPVVAQRHMESFERARASLIDPPRKAFAVRTLDNRPYQLPPLKLDHLLRMTDSTGIFQHAIFNVPNFAEGYCTDDNARAFILTLLLQETTSHVTQAQLGNLASIYLAFLWNAFDQESCRFRNFMSHQRKWLEHEGSEDSHGRALWATGTALGRSHNEGHRNLCALLFQRGLPAVENFSSPRAWAFALLAIQEYLRAFSGDRNANQLREVLTTRLVALFRRNSSDEWVWFEPVATYDNAKLSHAMILSGYWTSRGDVVEIGLNSLRWLVQRQTVDAGHFTPIGSNGFWTRGSEPARFDQQPIEAYAMISACVEAYSLTRDVAWHRAARRCFEWFLGRNDLGQPLYDSATGGCCDALHSDRVNQNQGAESSLAFQLSLAEMTRAEAVLFSETQKVGKNLNINPTGIELRPSPGRVLNRSFIPTGPGRVSGIIERVLDLSETEADAQLDRLRAEFGKRHSNLDESWMRHFEKIRAYVTNSISLSANRRLIVGAYFSGEYDIESAALFNPSIVAHPDQTDLDGADLRFILSLRAVGEGHISSIEFRTGVIHRNHAIEIDKISAVASAPEIDPEPTFPKNIFLHKLKEKDLENNWSRFVMNGLGATFTRTQLDESMQRAAHETQFHTEDVRQAIECVQWLVESNYEIDFDPAISLSERVIFPVSLNESNGIEDARFVRFVDEDESATYFATYTAYNGRLILPQLIETSDFLHLRIRTLAGPAIQNKGMALFPRRIDGRYAMLSRYDDENLYLMLSDDRHFWSDSKLLLRPSQSWEFVKIGNCGSPIETEAGWLVITHGVGPMRKYCLGAMLLDLQDPSKVIGRLNEPLLEPAVETRNGYVPNVVYTCGALVHDGRLILPYALNDTTTTIVTLKLETLITALTK